MQKEVYDEEAKEEGEEGFVSNITIILNKEQFVFICKKKIRLY